MTNKSLVEILAENTHEGELYERLPDGRLRCFACGHRCPIPEGKAGVCRVRFNEGGKLFVPAGYVGALQDDPIEKKPFFHAMPGARVLSFGMLGCDFHCGYCFPPWTRIATSAGVLPMGTIVSEKLQVEVYTHKGRQKKIKNFFERPYQGRMLRIKPAFLHALECTPGHPFLVCLRPDRFPANTPDFLPAEQLTTKHCLALPKRYEFSEEIILAPRDYLATLAKEFRAKRKIPAEFLERMMNLTRQGESSRSIAEMLGKSASHIRHLRSNVLSGRWNLKNLGLHKAKLIEENGTIRFSKEHAPGIPDELKLDTDFAELLGFYCAEGSVSLSRDRVHSATLNFAFGKKEGDKAQRVYKFIEKIFHVKPYLVNRPTTLAVVSSKTSLALLFKALCGGRGSQKKVPACLFRARREVVKAFLDAYVAGDGYRTPEGHIRISTISEELAWGVAWLVQKSGYLPQFYEYRSRRRRQLLGRWIRQSPRIYLVRWYEILKKQRHVWEDENYRYVLIKDIKKFDYSGPVYNLEVDEDHSYLANLVAVHNCQNWVTSQAIRDPNAVAPPVKIGAEELVQIALARDCEAVASTYNEPLITSEWAVAIFKEAKKAGLVTAYISNGNGTPEVLDFIRPWVDLYKVDLKGFDEQRYHELGGTLGNVCETIRGLYERKFWLETLTLLIPGFNDSDDEIKRLTEFITSVSPDIPWHVTAFHQDYKMTDRENTSARSLLRAAEIGKRSGLRYIYAGNLPGLVGDWENTYCPNCREPLIERYGFNVLKDPLTKTDGRCLKCRASIPGFWKKPNASRPSANRIQPLL